MTIDKSVAVSQYVLPPQASPKNVNPAQFLLSGFIFDLNVCR